MTEEQVLHASGAAGDSPQRLLSLSGIPEYPGRGHQTSHRCHHDRKGDRESHGAALAQSSVPVTQLVRCQLLFGL